MTIDYSKMPITEALQHFDNWPCLKIAELLAGLTDDDTPNGCGDECNPFV